MSEFETIICELISLSGTAKSQYILAIEAAKKGEDYSELIKQGDETFMKAHEKHFELLTKSANQNIETNLLIVHAEDQFCFAETCRVFAKEFIEIYKKLNK